MRKKAAKLAGSTAGRSYAAIAVFVYLRLRRYFADTVDHLAEGCVVYHSMIGEMVEHSGIYVGEYKIVSVNAGGNPVDPNAKIVKTSTRKFIEGGLNSNRLIWVSCRGESAVGASEAAERARKKVGTLYPYNVATNNCHQFTSGCLTGLFKNTDFRFGSLKETAARVLGVDAWRIWDRDKAIQRMCGKVIQEIVRDRGRLERLIQSDFDARERLLERSFDQLRTSYGIEDVNGFLGALAKIAPDLPWKDFETFDDWMCDEDTTLDLLPKKRLNKRP